MNVLCNMRHPNLIELLGFCNEDDEIMLVYELMNNGDLEQSLNKRDKPLSWEQRIKIATGAARALAFLHTPENNIIHRVIKPSVILLDREFNVKLSGLGCSREGPTDGATRVSTQLMGTAGYVDPQYAMTGHLDAKSDVYAFGIIMLQLLSGRKVFDRNRPRNEQSLLSYAHRYLTAERKLRAFMDPKLGNRYQLNHAFKLAKLCELCVDFEGSNRPHMQTILVDLESIAPVQVEACPVSSPSE
ncbi:probable serine/threonine-protein kinase PBL1 [Zingiber officinale]|nr:probable serine/threonine-protein kinase PBL1 [Zingiber officinale]